MQGYDKRPRNDACRLSWLIAKWKSYVHSRKRSFSFMGLGIIGRRAPNGTISANGLSARHCLVSGLTLTETPGVAADFRTFPLSETSACFPHCVERGENRSTGEDVLYGDQPVGMKLREVSRISSRYPRVRNEDGFEANWYHDGKGCRCLVLLTSMNYRSDGAPIPKGWFLSPRWSERDQGQSNRLLRACYHKKRNG